MNKDDNYTIFRKQIEQATNEINQKQSITTTRKGAGSIRDKLTFYKFAFFFAYGYIGLIQTMIIFLGVTPQAIKSINNFLLTLGITYQFPVDIASMITIIMIACLFIFGVFAMIYFGLYKREQEIGTMQSPGIYLLSKQNEEIIQLLKENKK